MTKLVERLLNKLESLVPAALNVRDGDSLVREPPTRPRRTEPAGHLQAGGHGPGSAIERTREPTGGEEVVVAAEALGRTDPVRDLDAFLQVVQPRTVAGLDAGSSEAVQRVGARLVHRE